jgi:hypothetical protein
VPAVAWATYRTGLAAVVWVAARARAGRL